MNPVELIRSRSFDDFPISAAVYVNLKEAINVIKERIVNGEEQLERPESDMLEKKEMVEAVLPAYRRFKSWAEEFDSADLEQKKMIACQIFDRIELGKGYRLTIHMNVTYK